MRHINFFILILLLALIFSCIKFKELATLTTNNTTNLTISSVTSGGSITNGGSADITSRGVCWSTSQNPAVSGSHTSDGTGTGSFTSNITGLTPGTKYYLRAYATNSVGIAYGNEVSFTTSILGPPTNVLATAGNAQATVTFTASASDGGSAITGYTVISSPGGIIATGTGSPIIVTGLTNGIAYTFTVIAINAAGNSLSSNASNSITPSTVASLATTTATSITLTTAVSGGNITIDGGGFIISRGVCWSTTANPTIADSHTTDGSGTGSFSSSITGLTANTIYHVRAYATNAVGTAYGNDVTFESGHTIPIVTTTAVSNITTTTATSGGNVLLQGGENVTAK